MYNDSYHFWGMHYGWWAIWIIMFFWIFVTPYDIPYQRSRKESALDVLKRRYAKGEINTLEYRELRDAL